MIVVADTGPIHYLILCGHIALLHDLYGQVVIPEAVGRELTHPAAPAAVRSWMAESLARRIARESRLPVKGTLGVLEEAAAKLHLDLKAALGRLMTTGIYLDQKTIDGALERDRIRRQTSP
jgi:predicted nucleic acid-binding protein